MPSDAARNFTLQETLDVLGQELREMGRSVHTSIIRALKFEQITEADKTKMALALKSDLNERLDAVQNLLIITSKGGYTRTDLEKTLRLYVDLAIMLRDKISAIESAVTVIEREILKREIDEYKKENVRSST